jgi:hypothetical protein
MLEVILIIELTTHASVNLRLAFFPSYHGYSMSTCAEDAVVERHIVWKNLLASSTGSVDQELLLRREYLVTEKRILREQIKGHIRLSDGQRKTLAAISKKIGKQAYEGRPHQAKGTVVLIPSAHDQERDDLMRCRERLGGLLKSYTREAA